MTFRSVSFLGAFALVVTLFTAPSQMRGDTVVTFGGAGLSCFNSTTTVACGGAQDNIWNTGDYISETFSGTGLASANQLSLSLSLFDNLDAGITDSWAIDLNGTQVGILSETGSGVSSYAQTFNFASVAGPNYTILFTVLAPGVPAGDGTLGLFTGGDGTSTATLSSSTITPEPSDLLLLLTGAASIGAAIVRGKKLRS
jgi:hypothetical protein